MVCLNTNRNTPPEDAGAIYLVTHSEVRIAALLPGYAQILPPIFRYVFENILLLPSWGIERDQHHVWNFCSHNEPDNRGGLRLLCRSLFDGSVITGPDFERYAAACNSIADEFSVLYPGEPNHWGNIAHFFGSAAENVKFVDLQNDEGIGFAICPTLASDCWADYPDPEKCRVEHVWNITTGRSIKSLKPKTEDQNEN